MTVTLIYTWDMKKMVVKTNERATSTAEGLSYEKPLTTDHGSQVKSDTFDLDMFTVQLDKRTKVMKLFHNQNELLSVTHDDKTYVERLFNTLLNTVKQKMRFWSTN